jgi:Na+/proline symporter
MHWLDWLIVGCYLVYITYDGLRLTKKSHEVEGYFLAGRSLPWWAVGLSVMATQLSAITLVSTTGQAYVDGMRFVQFYFGLPFAMIILCMTVVPFFYRAKVFTAYEYLEKRFDLKTRSLASFCFLVQRALACGTVIAAPAVVLSIVLGWNEWATILVMGLTTTVYTMFGGVQAVTWTDVKQMVVIFVGLFVVLYVIIDQFPPGVSVSEGLELAGAVGRLKTVDLQFSFKETYTFWSGLIGGMFLAMAYFGCDQSQVQRFLTARSVSEGRTSLLMTAFVKIPMQFLILFIGVMVFVFYTFVKPPMIFKADDRTRIQSNPEYQKLESEYSQAFLMRQQAALAFARAEERRDIAAITRNSYIESDKLLQNVRGRAINLIKKESNGGRFNDTNYIFPSFITSYAPAGVVGLIIAAIFAAAMSTISAELASLSTATVIDFYKRHFRQAAPDAHYLRVSKIATGLWGVFACIVALNATNLGSLIEVVNKFGSYFYGSLLGVFMLALGTKRATANGAFFGLIAGVATVAIMALFWEVSFLWYNVIGALAVVTVGMTISLFDPGKKRE